MEIKTNDDYLRGWGEMLVIDFKDPNISSDGYIRGIVKEIVGSQVKMDNHNYSDYPHHRVGDPWKGHEFDLENYRSNLKKFLLQQHQNAIKNKVTCGFCGSCWYKSKFEEENGVRQHEGKNECTGCWYDRVRSEKDPEYSLEKCPTCGAKKRDTPDEEWESHLETC